MSDYKLTRDDLERAALMVYQTLGPTPQFAWPLLSAELNADVWVKHENFTPTGAFKVRGGLVYFHELLAAGPRPAGVISATRGNHGQSVGYAARKNKVAATIVEYRPVFITGDVSTTFNSITDRRGCKHTPCMPFMRVIGSCSEHQTVTDPSVCDSV